MSEGWEAASLLRNHFIIPVPAQMRTPGEDEELARGFLYTDESIGLRHGALGGGDIRTPLE